MKTIGIDPGIKGGLAFLEDGLLKKLCKMPLVKEETKKKKKLKSMTAKEKKERKAGKTIYTTKFKVDSKTIMDWIAEFKPDLVVIEQPFYLAIESRTSTATIAENVGRLYGIAEGLGLNLLKIRPQKWKGYFELGADKQEAIEKAEELFPSVNLIPARSRTKHDGMAEALLLAKYGEKFRFN